MADRKRLRALRHLPSVEALSLGSDLPEAELGAALEGIQVEMLLLIQNTLLTGVSWLSAVADSLSLLSVEQCPGVRDLTPLTGLGKLRILLLDAEGMPLADLAPLANLPSLTDLSLRRLSVDRLSEIPAHPGVSVLRVTNFRPLTLDGLGAWKSLRALRVTELAAFDDALVKLREHSRITDLQLTAFPWGSRPDHAVSVPTIEKLSVPAPPPGENVARLRTVFPWVTRLTLDASGRRTLNLTPLRSWPGLSWVEVVGAKETRLIGAEGLGDRLDVSPFA
ncbi:hypothetical protein [Streptomyces sp. cmx-18-6]|uniref:hypothetical protein n=1 Tax=Streptomyces sp. cmx-18-6 TaxID=2790930 RepID=UPI0039810657